MKVLSPNRKIPFSDSVDSLVMVRITLKTVGLKTKAS